MWKNHKDIVKNINQVISTPACDKQEQKMLHNCQQIRVYIHHQSQNIAIYVHKILQKHECSPRQSTTACLSTCQYVEVMYIIHQKYTVLCTLKTQKHVSSPWLTQ